VCSANANVVPIIGYYILDLLVRPKLLADVRAEISAATDVTKSGYAALNMSSLLSNPLLQSIWSEELRLRVSVMILRAPVFSDFKIRSWLFPKGENIVASSWHEQRDRNVWNEGATGERSVDEFWPERFLVFPNDPYSGPGKTTAVKGAKEEKPFYTTEGVNGSFIPFGGGSHICSGRFYAKAEAFGAIAMLLNKFDVELLDKNVKKINELVFPF